MDYYSLLEVPITASQSEISKAFKKLAIKYHPDKTEDPRHHELFKQINEAYETLKSIEKRKDYDLKYHPTITKSSGAPSSQWSSYTFEETPINSSGGFTRRYNRKFTQTRSGADMGPVPGPTGFGYLSSGNYGVFSRHYNDRFSPEDLFEKERRAQQERLRKEAERIRKQQREHQRAHEEELLRTQELLRRQREKEKKQEQRQQQKQRQQEERQEECDNSVSGSEKPSSSSYDDYYNLHAQRKKASNGHWSRPFQTFDNNNFQFSSMSNVRTESNTYSSPEEPSTDKSKGDSNDPIVVDDEFSDSQSDESASNSIKTDGSRHDASNSEPIPRFPGDANTGMDEDYNSDIPENMKSNFDDNTKGNNENNDDDIVFQSKEDMLLSRFSSEVEDLEGKTTGFSKGDGSQVEIEVEEISSGPDQQFESTEKTPEVVIQEEFERRMKNEPSDHFLKKKKPRKPHSFAFNEFKDTLNPDIGNVDFTEVKNNLPNYEGDSHDKEQLKAKSRTKLSNPNGSKKPRLSEFSNGSSNADTLHIPINRNSIKGYAVNTSNNETTGRSQTLNMLDFNASTKVRNLVPPKPPTILLTKDLTKEVWESYVKAIHGYQREFFNYKAKIIIYQTERASRDKELFDLVNSDQTCFEVYQRCLDQDLVVMKDFHENLRVFNTTMESYKQHCHWKEMANLF